MGRIDVNDFIVENGGNPAKIKESQKRRCVKDGEAAVDEVIALFKDHKTTNYEATQVKANINAIQKDIGKAMKAKEDAEPLKAQKVELEKKYKELTEAAAEKDVLLKRKVNTIGNYVHDSVPVSDNEDNNVVERIWAPKGITVEKKAGWHLSHHDVLTRLDGWDSERGVKIAGHRAYFLKGMGFFLNDALKAYGLQFLYAKGYEPLQTPQFMSQASMAKTAQLEQFDEELYKVDDGGDPKYLIATSEQPISAMYQDEWMTTKDLPKKLAGTSTCYRKEAGKHGKDAWGLFRTHQFDKVEQFLITDPEKSWDAFEEMIKTSEEFYQSLGIPYQVVTIVSGALNDAAAKKYDLEGWFPFQGEYKELVSCSNCTDYQSRDLEVRFGQKLKTETRKKYVHMLNCTLSATGRTLCAILENFQTEEGFNVPEPLRKFIPGEPAFIPYVKDLAKDSTSQRMKDLKVVGE